MRAVLLALTVVGITAAPSASREWAIGLLAVGVAAAILYARAERTADVPIIPREAWLGRGPAGSSLQAIAFYTGAYTGANGSCLLDNHIRQISFGVQEQSGTFTCAIAFGNGLRGPSG